MWKVKIISNPISFRELEDEVNEFINRDDVGEIDSVQFNGHSVLILYRENVIPEPEPFYTNN